MSCWLKKPLGVEPIALTLASPVSVRVGAVATEQLEGLALRADVLIVCGVPFEVGMGLVFVSLLVQANPVVESRLDQIEARDLSRLLFWAGIGGLIWPFLRLAALRQRITTTERDMRIGPRWRPAMLNPGSVSHSLILFNLLFAVQTGLDATYLIGSATLPEGMSYAEYAHHGAYPLLIATLLAGVFALADRPEIRRHAPGLCDHHYGPYAPIMLDWREWGFRDWRTFRSLTALNAASPGI